MYLTQEDLEKILYYLGKTGIKDSEFPELIAKIGDEELVIIAGGINQRVSIPTFFKIAKGDNKASLVGTDILFQNEDYDSVESLLLAIIAYIIESALNIYLNAKAISSNKTAIKNIILELKSLGIYISDPDEDPSTPDNPTSTEFRILYKPASTIPDDMLCTPHGNLKAISKSVLATMNYNEILDSILFTEKEAYINYNEHDNSIKSIEDIEVGASYSSANFSSILAIAKFGYPEQTKQWELETIVTSGNVKFGAVNPGTAKFILLFGANTTLYTNYNNRGSKTLEDLSYTMRTYLKGYYNLGFTYGDTNEVPTSFIGFKITENCNNKLISISTSSKYIYLAIPIELNLIDFKVLDPLDKNAYNTINNFLKISTTPVDIPSLSSINKYYIWRAGKATNNEDGTPTANNKNIQITTST